MVAALQDSTPATACQVTAWRHTVCRSRLAPRVKLTALILADFAESDGSNAYPGVDLLAELCELSNRTVLRHLKCLRELGAVVALPRTGKPRHWKRCYRLVLSPALAALVPSPGDRKARINGASHAERTRQQHARNEARYHPVDNSRPCDTKDVTQYSRLGDTRAVTQSERSRYNHVTAPPPRPAQRSALPRPISKPSSSQVSASGAVRAVFPDATDDEIRQIETLVRQRGARSAAAVINHMANTGELSLPCGRNPRDHGQTRLNAARVTVPVYPYSAVCRTREGSTCDVGWCACRCHTKPRAQDADQVTQVTPNRASAGDLRRPFADGGAMR